MKLKQFIKENKTAIITVFLLGLITYGIKLITYGYSIDTEYFLSDKDAMLTSWIGIDRYGLVFIKQIIDLPYINIYMANFVGFILLFLSVILCMYNIESITKSKNKIANILLGALIITSPIIVMQFSFTLQCVEVNLGLLLLCLAFTLINKSFEHKNKQPFLILGSIICTTFAFSCYQSFAPLFITISAFFAMLFIHYKNEKGIRIILKYIAIFLVSFILYKVIDEIVLSITQIEKSSYLNNQILWKTKPFGKTVMNVIFGVSDTLTKNSDFHSIGLLLCIAEYIYIIFNKFDKKKWIFYISILTFIISPLLLNIYTGDIPTIRARMQFPFVLGFSVYFLYLWSDSKLEKKIRTIIFGIIIFSQIILSVKLFYTEYETFQQEKAFAVQIENDIMARNINDEKTKIFIGHFSSEGYGIVYKAETMGYTFFDYDKFGPTGSNDRIQAFLESLGYKEYNRPTQEQYDEAKKISEDMPVYPNEGSIKEEQDYVIIKIN